MNPLTAKQLLQDLQALEMLGHDLSKITINYRTDTDSDVEVVTYIGDDLYDAETNSILESLVLMADASDF
jgi:hypothetical protein